MAGSSRQTGFSPFEVLLQSLGESCIAVAGFISHGVLLQSSFVISEHGL
jgi:hypothetical protein